MSKNTPAVTAAQKRLKGSQDLIGLMMTPQTQQCLKDIQIKEITKPGQVDVVKANVKELKSVVKKIQDKRKEFTSPLEAEKKQYIALEKAVLLPLETAIANVNKVTGDYLTKQAKLKEEEEAKLRSQQMDKVLYHDVLIEFIKGCLKEFDLAFEQNSKTPAINAYVKYLDPKSNDSKYVQMIVDYTDKESQIKAAQQFLINIGKYISAKVDKKITAETAKERIDAIKHQIHMTFEISIEDVGEKEEQKIQKTAVAAKSAAKGTYVSVDYEVLDISKIPSEFTKIVLDTEKVNAFKKDKANQKAIVEGKQPIPGLKFSYEHKIRG